MVGRKEERNGMEGKKEMLKKKKSRKEASRMEEGWKEGLHGSLRNARFRLV